MKMELTNGENALYLPRSWCCLMLQSKCLPPPFAIGDKKRVCNAMCAQPNKYRLTRRFFYIFFWLFMFNVCLCIKCILFLMRHSFSLNFHQRSVAPHPPLHALLCMCDCSAMDFYLLTVKERHFSVPCANCDSIVNLSKHSNSSNHGK